MFAALLPTLLPLLGEVLRRVIPDPEAAAKAMQEVQTTLIMNAGAMERAAADIVKSEAESEHWLTATWRPILMLTFGALIVARWLGWSAPGISEAEAIKLWGIIEIGLGGYVIGRSAEKIVPQVAAVMGQRR